jgi:hypothetical protein
MFKLPKEARKIGKDSTHGSVMPKHLSKSLRVYNGSKVILAKLSPSNMITIANLAKEKGKSNYHEEQHMIRDQTNFHQEVLP